jgi:hypothetical protein
MRIIKHKSRRQRDPAPWYFVVEGVHAVGQVENAVDIAIDVLRDEMSTARRAPTLWDIYGEYKCVA